MELVSINNDLYFHTSDGSVSPLNDWIYSRSCPLEGGLDGKSWTFGRSVYISEVYSLLNNVDGVDYITDIKLNDSVEAIALKEHELLVVQLEEISFTLQEASSVSGKATISLTKLALI